MNSKETTKYVFVLREVSDEYPEEIGIYTTKQLAEEQQKRLKKEKGFHYEYDILMWPLDVDFNSTLETNGIKKYNYNNTSEEIEAHYSNKELYPDKIE